jgi:hypothetical protein
MTCVDCGERAYVHEHRSYVEPDKTEPVCRSCNARRGPADFSWILEKRGITVSDLSPLFTNIYSLAQPSPSQRSSIPVGIHPEPSP